AGTHAESAGGNVSSESLVELPGCSVTGVGLVEELRIDPSFGPARGACGPASAEQPHVLINEDPAALVLSMGRAYSAREAELYAQGMTRDFRFLFAEPELRAQHPGGFTREDEIASATHLFHGFTDREGIEHPAARLIDVRLDSLYVLPDPDRRDSSDGYRLVVVPR